ncbi:biotin--[acetyl-CoA-carboxylase] ligase [Plastoroseomonas arctica]|uniref:Biotin--[acetyl-CoA-carboxylase] ligase n=1 Tax=Plastoroseomonas arctica TaxID=1509237 RepID=A0AAF1KR15_9PROT|nr:biotin--[acetyl-CoA-carboxylase] ligase [Plastoroseomonas arctica]
MKFSLRIEQSLPSTQTVAVAEARAGAPEGTAILARQQTAGRGRGERAWSSPMGNLSLSLVLRPQAPMRDSPQWALRAAVALAETLLPYAPELRLKWPNDVMLGNAKLAGILAEAEADAEGGIAHLVLGIGANLAHAPELPGRATACLPPPHPAPEDVAEALLGAIAMWHAAPFAAVREAWLARGPSLGAPLTLRDGRKGLFAGMAENGNLLLDVAGRTQAIFAGELD